MLYISGADQMEEGLAVAWLGNFALHDVETNVNLLRVMV